MIIVLVLLAAPDDDRGVCFLHLLLAEKVLRHACREMHCSNLAMWMQ